MGAKEIQEALYFSKSEDAPLDFRTNRDTTHAAYLLVSDLLTMAIDVGSLQVQHSIVFWLETHLTKLERIYERYRDDYRCGPLETLMLFGSMEKDESRLKDVWRQKSWRPCFAILQQFYGWRI
jgi:hypothetical protein